MTEAVHTGSCHCGAIAFEATFDPATAETLKCNCTWCLKHRFWSLSIPMEKFRALKGAELVEGQDPASIFCPTCHAMTYIRRAPEEWNPDARVQMSVAAFDTLSPQQMADLRVIHLDGLSDTWAPLQEGTGYL